MYKTKYSDDKLAHTVKYLLPLIGSPIYLDLHIHYNAYPMVVCPFLY